jgi:hypothetical protein
MSTTIEIRVKTFDGQKHTVRIKRSGSAGIVLTPDNPVASITLSSDVVAIHEYTAMADLNLDDPNKVKPKPVETKAPAAKPSKKR